MSGTIVDQGTMEWHSSQPLTLARCFSGSLITVHILLYLRWCRNALGRAQLHVFMVSPCTVKGKGSRCYCTAAHTDGLFIYTVVVWCVIWTPTCLFGVLGLVKCHPGAPAPRPTSSDSRARAYPRESLERYAVTIQTCFTQIVLMSLFLSPSDWESVYVLVEY